MTAALASTFISWLYYVIPKLMTEKCFTENEKIMEIRKLLDGMD
jgi:hypothetical protein